MRAERLHDAARKETHFIRTHIDSTAGQTVQEEMLDFVQKESMFVPSHLGRVWVGLLGGDILLAETDEVVQLSHGEEVAEHADDMALDRVKVHARSVIRMHGLGFVAKSDVVCLCVNV